MSVRQSPTLRRKRLGIELRRLREDAELTIEEVAKHLGCSDSKVSRIETGKGTARRRDVARMLDLYGVTDETQRDLLLTIVKEAQQKGWWTDYEDVLPARFETYIGLEAEAATVRSYDQALVPGLLQTTEYARSVIQETRRVGADEVERLVALRMKRQELLTREDDPLELWTVLDEAALHRTIGGRPAMRDQLHRLLELTELANVTIQVLPYDKGAHAGLGGSFSIIELPEPTGHEVVYIDCPAGNIYLEKAKDVRWHTRVFDHLRAAALDPKESAAFITTVASKEMA